MAKETILIIEDEEHIQELIKYNLAKEGYEVDCLASGEDGLEAARLNQPDLVLLDLMLPGLDGLEVCKFLKSDSQTRQIPIIMVTAKGEESDIVTGLELGADDYITKPFSPRILIARVKNVLRRNKVIEKDSRIQLHNLVIHPGRHEVLVEGRNINLTTTEFRILHYLASRPGWVFTRSQIVDEVHGDDYPVTERSIDVQVVGLRKKLGPAGEYIQTVWGVGYRFREDSP